MAATRREFIQSGAAGAALLAAGSSAVAQSGNPTVTALRQFLQSNAFRYLSLPPVADELPAATLAGPSSNWGVPTTLPAGTLYPITGPLIGGPIRGHLRASLPGNPVINGMPCCALTRSYTCKGQPRSMSAPAVHRFRTDARVIEIAGVQVNGPFGGITETLMIDGRLVPPHVLGASPRGAAGGWCFSAVRLDFRYRAMREIWLNTSAHLAFVKIDSGDALASLPAAEPQLTVVGDSYLLARSAHFGDGSLAMEIGARLGIRNVAVDGIGGTGYWNSGADVGNLNDRLPAHAADQSQIYLVMAGINDYGDVVNNPPRTVWPSRTAYEQAVFGYLAALRAARPDAVIVVTAPFCPIPPMSDATYVANQSINSSGVGDFLYKADLQRRAVQAIAGPWVYLDVLMGGGWINSSGASGDVTNLQWFTGGTPGPGTTASYRPGNTRGGAGGAFGGLARVPVISGGSYTQTPTVRAVGGSGSGALLAARLNPAGQLVMIDVYGPGMGYSLEPGGLPTIVVDGTYAIAAATLGAPELSSAVNPNGMYPLPSFTNVEAARLNNAPQMLLADTIHPSPRGVSYLSARLASNIFDAVMAL
jgi:lysophospholipase L1-like esterase